VNSARILYEILYESVRYDTAGSLMTPQICLAVLSGDKEED